MFTKVRKATSMQTMYWDTAKTSLETWWCKLAMNQSLSGWFYYRMQHFFTLASSVFASELHVHTNPDTLSTFLSFWLFLRTPLFSLNMYMQSKVLTWTKSSVCNIRFWRSYSTIKWIYLRMSFTLPLSNLPVNYMNTETQTTCPPSYYHIFPTRGRFHCSKTRQLGTWVLLPPCAARCYG